MPGDEKPEKAVKPVPEIVEPEIEVESEEELVTYYTEVQVREPFVHTVGRQALSFGMAFVAERLSSLTYDAILKAYRARKKPF